VSVTSQVVVRDPVDPRELFDTATAAVGASPDGARVYDFGEVHMLRARPGQGAAALVSVHYAADGGPYPRDEGTDQPPGHALVSFTTDGCDREAALAGHSGAVTAVAGWLAERGARWAAQFEDEAWTAGAVRDEAETDGGWAAAP